MKKLLLILALLTIPLARSSGVAPTQIDVIAQPDHTYIGGNVTYIASLTQSSDVITASLTLTITAHLSNINIETTPISDCSARNNITLVIVLCSVTDSPALVVVRGTVLGGTAQMVTVTGDLDGAITQDVQWVDGVRSVYLPMVSAP